MKLTPLDVRKQEFSRQMRGYDLDEVRSFLESVADAYEQAINENQSLNKQLATLQTRLQDYQQMETSLQDAAMSATKAAREAEDRSSREADLLVQSAQLEAEQIITDSRRQRQQIEDDIARLEGQRRSFILTLKHVLRNQVDLLEILEQDPLDRVLDDNHAPGDTSGDAKTERSPRDPQHGNAR